jgi:beta-lactamase class A
VLELLATLLAISTPLGQTLTELADRSGSTVGIFVEHLERRETIAVHGARPFPLASTFKLPLAVAALQAVEQRELPALDQKVRLEATDMIPWASPLHARLPAGGEVTLRELLATLLQNSDNSAADALLRLLGGPVGLRPRLARLGLGGLSIDRDEAELALDGAGVAYPPRSERTAAHLSALLAHAPPAERNAALARLRADPRDHGTPEVMAHLLARLWRGELLSPPHRALLRDELSRCTTGRRRLRAGVPPGTPVADRTGTCAGGSDASAICANDVGVLGLPSGEHVVVAVFVEDAGGEVASKEKLIAAIARAAWEHYRPSQRP